MAALPLPLLQRVLLIQLAHAVCMRDILNAI